MPGRSDDADIQMITSCPRCGSLDSVSPTATLSIVSCANCQQLHVANLGDDVPESDEATSPADELTPPEVLASKMGRIGRYRVTRVLGSGTFGVVYQAWDPSLRRWVAIKVPKVVEQDRELQVNRFLQEGRAAAKLRHPLIIPVFDADQVSGQPYIVSEYVEGETLADVLRLGVMSPRRAAKIVFELATGLHHAHQQGVIHRDIKPGNVMIDSERRPRLMDFGLAWQTNDTSSAQEGPRAGTPAYMPPEQIRGQLELITKASDQYSLGVVFFECLTGRRPFEGPVAQVLRNILSQRAPSLRSINPELPEELDTICERMLEPHPADRYPDLGEVAKELARFLKPKPGATTADISKSGKVSAQSAPKSHLKLPVWGVAAAIAIAFGLIGFGIASLGRSSVDATPATLVAPQVASTTVPLTPTAEVPLEPASDIPMAPETLPTQPPVAEQAHPVAPVAPLPARIVPVMIGEPGIDALLAVEQAAQDRAQEELFDQLASYPPLQLGRAGEEEIAAFREQLQSLLDSIFVSRASKNEARIREVSQRLLHLQQENPLEPRIPYVMAILSKSWRSPGVKASDLLGDELALLQQAREVGGYTFTPAQLSEVEYWLVRKEHTKANQAILEIAGSLTDDTPWPDRAEQVRIVSWLGRVHGFFASGVNGLESRNTIFVESQDQLVSRLPEKLRQVFLSSLVGVQEEIAAELESTEQKLNADLQKNLESGKQKLSRNLADQGDLAGKIAIEQLESESLEQWMSRMRQEFTTQYDGLARQADGIQLRAVPLLEAHAVARENLASSANNLLQTQANATGDPQQDLNAISFAERAVQQAQSRVSLLTSQILALEAQYIEVKRRAAGLIQQLKNFETQYAKQAQLDDAVMKKLQADLNVLENQNKDLVEKIDEPKKKLSRDQKVLKELRHWVPSQESVAPDWLAASLNPAEIMP